MLHNKQIQYRAVVVTVVLYDRHQGAAEMSGKLRHVQGATLSPGHTSNNVKVTFDFVEATFDFVAKKGNNVERVYGKFRLFDKVKTN